MNILIAIGLILAAFAGMELMAWYTHKYVMHGNLWIWHKDHHTREHAPLEWNDLFALIFSGLSILFIIQGSSTGDFRLWIGIGILLYGIAYFFLHDMLVHERLPFFLNKNHWYLRGIMAAHNDHHTGGANYGFVFMIPWHYFKNPAQVNQGYHDRDHAARDESARNQE